EDHQAAGGTPRRQQRRAGATDPGDGRAGRRTDRGHDGRRGPPRGRARREGGMTAMAIFLTDASRVLVQGITGTEGTRHTRRMVAAGTNIVAGVTPGKGGQDVDGIPVFNSAAEAVAATGADVSVVFVPPRFAKAAVVEAIDAELDLAVV